MLTLVIIELSVNVDIIKGSINDRYSGLLDCSHLTANSKEMCAVDGKRV
jgi:hypothetical protein